MNGLSEKDNELLDEDSLVHLDHFFRDRLPIIKTIGDGDPLSRIAPVFHKMFVIQMILDDQFMIDMCHNFETNKVAGLYDGVYKFVELAMGLNSR